MHVSHQPEKEAWNWLLRPMTDAPNEPEICFGPCLLLSPRADGVLDFSVGVWDGSAWCTLDWELLHPIRWALLPPAEDLQIAV
jgi:hypothetical protein